MHIISIDELRRRQNDDDYCSKCGRSKEEVRALNYGGVTLKYIYNISINNTSEGPYCPVCYKMEIK